MHTGKTREGASAWKTLQPCFLKGSLHRAAFAVLEMQRLDGKCTSAQARVSCKTCEPGWPQCHLEALALLTLRVSVVSRHNECSAGRMVEIVVYLGSDV